MTHRATFALDLATATRIQNLAKLWKVSQAEVVRRAIAMAELPSSEIDPVAMLDQLHEAGAGLSAEAAEAHLLEVRQDRKSWRAA